ncbi:hypothetical protein CCYA_CCYA04G1259 [Cyanidiococcus yangmingshanensis]|nr:hypothetical protein CCYA_CCYA04G1259 [Cyanidiococcus yangmingshanensis]
MFVFPTRFFVKCLRNNQAQGFRGLDTASRWSLLLRLRVRRTLSAQHASEGLSIGVSTPLLRHWAATRRRYPQYVLLYQVGDFFECFKEDAVTLSEALGVALTRRGVGKDATPMAGIPVRSLDAHLYRLIQAGLRVALCEQIEPVPHQARRLIQRRVTRLVTPGTYVDSLHASTENNFLVSIALPLRPYRFLESQDTGHASEIAANGDWCLPSNGQHWLEEENASSYYGVSWIDLSTGNEVNCSLESVETIAESLSRLQPREVLLRGAHGGASCLLSTHTALGRAIPDHCLISHYEDLSNSVATEEHSLGDVTFQERSAVEALLSYVQYIREPSKESVVSTIAPCSPESPLRSVESSLKIVPVVKRFETHKFMRMDASTRRALELHRSWRDSSSRHGSLLAAIDATVTAPGARLLSMRLSCPLMDPDAIDGRLDAVEFFVKHRAMARELRKNLQKVLDIERTAQRIALSSRSANAVGEPTQVDEHHRQNLLDYVTGATATAQMQTQIRDLIALGETLGRSLHIRDCVWKPYAGSLDHHAPCVQAIQKQMERICCDHTYATIASAFVDISDPSSASAEVRQFRTEDMPGLGEHFMPNDSASPKVRSHAFEDRQVSKSRPNRSQFGAIREGFSAELDGVRLEWEQANRSISTLEQFYRQLFGLRTLRVRSNNVLGWYLELTRREASRHSLFRQAQIHGKWEQLTPDILGSSDQKFIIEDTSVNATNSGYDLANDAVRRLGETRNTVRFRTRLLERLEAQRIRAESRFIRIQQDVLFELSRQCTVDANARTQIRETAAALSELDVAAGLAQVAHEYHYVRPILHPIDRENPRCIIHIVNGRHPTVERSVQNFVPNSCYLEITNREETASPSLLLLTSANASGKSTYLRQVALITILAQIGSFVPADFCELHPADCVFARVGAASGDDLLSARSTFFLEMEETATILHRATPRSLVVLDEVGRGTSSEDGMAIGEAVATALAPRCRTLFATHYHEISRKIQEPSHPVSKRTRCMTTKVERDSESQALTFSYRLCDGVASSSFGIEVARLAGLPEPVLRHAESIIKSNGARASSVTLPN